MSKLRAFTMPKWGIEMTEGTIAEWSIREGDPVTQGQTIALIESDKIVNEVQAEFDTRFVRLIATAGEAYPVGTLLAVMAGGDVTKAEVDSFIAAFRPAGAAAEAQADSSRNPAGEPKGQPAAVAPAAVVTIPADMQISPQARKRAGELKIDVRSLAGSGRKGRITLQDVEQASRPRRAVGGGASVSIVPSTASLDAFYASPGAKRLALKHRVDLASVKATGARGRISRTDVARDAGIPLGTSAGAEVIRMSPTRKAIARQLSHSKSTIPHFYLRLEAQLDALQAVRAGLKKQSGAAPGLNDYLVRATALALAEVPEVNIQVHGEEIHRFADANIAVAVATDRGLVTPVVRAAQRKSATDIAAELRPLIERARANRLRSDDVDGASFTVSNLGMFGVEQFDAIINPPQGAILAIGAATRRPVEQGDRIAFGTFVWLSLSCDHRAIDGAVGGRFLSALKAVIEGAQGL